MYPVPARFYSGLTEVRYEFCRRPYLVDAKAAASDDLFVTAGVKIREPFGKLEFVSIDGDRTERALLGVDVRRQVVDVDREEPADVGILAFKEAARPRLLAKMSDAAPSGAENEHQHIEEMNAD